MSHRPLYKKSSSCVWKVVIFIAAAIYALVWAYQQFWVFNPDKLVENSVLKEKNFETPVKEIISSGYGIKAYWFKDSTNPIVSISMIFKNAGYASDNEGEQGIANMAASLLTEGAGELNSQAFKEELEMNAIGLSFSADKDDFSASLLTTKENLPKALELLKAALTAPRFEDADVSRVKAQFAEALKRQQEHPADKLNLAFLHELYGNHPYGHNPIGKESDILNITQLQLKTFVKDNFSRQNLIVGIAGDINEDEAKQLLDNVFGSLPENGKINFVRAPELKFDGRDVKLKENSEGQNITMKAAQGVSRNDEDFYPLFVANHILGGSGLSSVLSQEIREKKGLTYGVYSYLSLDDKAPLLVASFSATPDKYTEAEKLFEEQWLEFGKNGVSKKQLEKAKNYLVASYNLRFASIDNIANILTAMQKYDLGLDFLQKRNDYVQQVNLKQVNEAAQKYFNKDKLVNVSIGSF